jgi:hypothetical protein
MAWVSARRTFGVVERLALGVPGDESDARLDDVRDLEVLAELGQLHPVHPLLQIGDPGEVELVLAQGLDHLLLGMSTTISMVSMCGRANHQASLALSTSRLPFSQRASL